MTTSIDTSTSADISVLVDQIKSLSNDLREKRSTTADATTAVQVAQSNLAVAQTAENDTHDKLGAAIDTLIAALVDLKSH